jgi:hypothetical protein
VAIFRQSVVPLLVLIWTANVLALQTRKAQSTTSELTLSQMNLTHQKRRLLEFELESKEVSAQLKFSLSRSPLTEKETRYLQEIKERKPLEEREKEINRPSKNSCRSGTPLCSGSNARGGNKLHDCMWRRRRVSVPDSAPWQEEGSGKSSYARSRCAL